MESDRTNTSPERPSFEGNPGPQRPVPPASYGRTGAEGVPPYDGYPPYSTLPPPTGSAPQRGVPWYVWLIGGCLGIVIVAGVSCAVVAGLAGTYLGGIAHDLARETPVATTATSTYAISDAPNIVVHNVTGTISVKPGGDGVVTVEVTKSARDTSTTAAQADLARIVVDIAQRNNAITIDVRAPDSVSLTRQASVDLVITVPVGKPDMANLDLTEVTGTIAIDGIKGTLMVAATTGDVELTGVSLVGSSRLHVATGQVQVEGSLARGASLAVTVTTGGVMLTLPVATPAQLEAAATIGKIDISGWSIPITSEGVGARASGDLSANPDGRVVIQVTTGDITLTSTP